MRLDPAVLAQAEDGSPAAAETAPVSNPAPEKMPAEELPPAATARPEPAASPIPETTEEVSPTATAGATPVPEQEQATPEIGPVQAEVVAAALNVREGPGMNYTSIGTAAKGDVFDITGVSANGSWLQIVTAAGEPGWISGRPDYTRVLGSLDTVPAVEPQAPASASPSFANNTQAATTTATTGDGRLVFATGSGGNLYMVNADGTGLSQLASGVIDPVVSPDGQQVAFTRWDGAEFGTLYVMNLDGSGELAVLSEILQAKSPTWSPDSQEIIISFQHGGLRDPKEECKTFDADDGISIPQGAQITSSHFNRQNGNFYVCFIRREDLRWSLRQVDVQTGEFEDLPADLYSYSPAWDPQNAWRLVYNSDGGLMQLDLNTGQKQPLTENLRDTGPVFSPDGTKLALTYKQHDHWEVYTYDLASGSRQRLTKPPLLADPQYNSAAPAWSPDGSQIAFVTDRSGQWEIWLMNADGSDQHPLLSSEALPGLEYWGMNERLLNWIP